VTPGRCAWRAVCLVVAAVLLGVYADVGSYAPGFLRMLPELGAPWVLLAFAGGRAAHRWVASAVAGPGLILVGLGSYWLFMRVAYDVELYQYVGNGRGLHWVSLGIVLGVAAGLMGRASTSTRWLLRWGGWGFAVGVPLVEAHSVLLRSWYPRPGPLAGVLLATAAGVALLAWRKTRSAPTAVRPRRAPFGPERRRPGGRSRAAGPRG
jgi:hypothetical protein